MKIRKGQGSIWLAKTPLLWEEHLLNFMPSRDHFLHRKGLGAVAVGLFAFFVSPRRQSCWESRRERWPLHLKSLHSVLERTCRSVQRRDHFVFWEWVFFSFFN